MFHWGALSYFISACFALCAMFTPCNAEPIALGPSALCSLLHLPSASSPARQDASEVLHPGVPVNSLGGTLVSRSLILLNLSIEIMS